MRNIFTIITILISASCLAQEAEIFFEKDFIKHPKVLEGEAVSMYFPFQNTGNKPLTLLKHHVSCVCTKVRMPLKPIMPQERDSIYVFFDSIGKQGNNLRSISIHHNGSNSPSKIAFKVNVKKP